MAQQRPRTKKRTEALQPSGMSPRRRNQWFIGVIILFTFLLYGNSIRNHYSLDDYHISPKSEEIMKGISAVPEIFTTVYAMEREATYAYRPVVRASYAIEYSVFGPDTWLGSTLQTLAAGMNLVPSTRYQITPHISHFFNVLLYLAILLVLFRILKRLFRDFHPAFALLITLLFAAHPIHTEIVASLKSRDELFAMLFLLISLWQLIRFADTEKKIHVVWSVLLFILAFLSKETSAAFFTIYPFTLYFFTDLGHRKTTAVTLIMLVVGVAAVFVPFLFIPFYDRPILLEENPLPYNDTFLNRISFGAYTLYYYFKLMLIPHPLLYYYGYNMVPITGFGNVWVILSILFHGGLLYIAIRKFHEKHILSFAILVYLGTIAMFTNAVYPAPGIIAERFLLYPSLGFSIALGYGLTRLMRVDRGQEKVPVKRWATIFLLAIIILAPYSAKTITRNNDWKTEYSLYHADMRYLYNSVKANDLYANEIMKTVNRELQKPVNVLKFIEPQVQESLSHYERAVKIQPTYYSGWNSIGIIHSRIYKEYDTAIYYFNRALELKPEHPQTYFNLGQAYEGLERWDDALRHYEKSIELDPTAISAYSRSANIYYRFGEFKKAIEMNQDIARVDPKQSLPYINIGNYYVFQGDTTKGVEFYEKGIELGAPYVASEFVSKFYKSRGDDKKYQYYKNIAERAKQEGRYYQP